MLTHTSGIGNYSWKSKGGDSLAIKKYAISLKHRKLKYNPGVQLSYKTYSNTAYSVLGYLIEKITKQPFTRYMKDSIFQPVGMNFSDYSYERFDKSHLGKAHFKSNMTGKIRSSGHYPDDPHEQPNGNLISCSHDLCKWMLHNLSIYRDTANTFNGVISHNSLVEMWTTTQSIPNKKTSIGLGWWIVNEQSPRKYVFHVGNNPGFSATIIIFPQDDFGMVLLSNSEYAMNAVWNKISFAIIDILKAHPAIKL